MKTKTGSAAQRGGADLEVWDDPAGSPQPRKGPAGRIEVNKSGNCPVRREENRESKGTVVGEAEVRKKLDCPAAVDTLSPNGDRKRGNPFIDDDEHDMMEDMDE